MRTALIGHTGFVGGNLLRQASFDACFNTSNVHEIDGQAFDLLVCSAAPAVKWWANKHPDEDGEAIRKLTARLEHVSADHVVLISTVDVYPRPIDVDESTEIDVSSGHAYGVHRLELEQFVESRFATTTIRLPGLFGPGIKKNVIYDFLNDNNLTAIDADGVFQFYDLAELWADIQTVRRHGVARVNFGTEPVSVRDVARVAFGLTFENHVTESPARYDMRTLHDHIFGGRDGYMRDRTHVLERMRLFVESAGWCRP